MSYKLTATQARTISFSDLTIHDIIDYMERQIIAASLNGDISVIVDDGNDMTTSTPTITATGTIANPSITRSNTLILAGTTITLSADAEDGIGLNAVIAAINDKGATGLTATKDSSNRLVINYEPSQSDWTFLIGAGTANAEVGLTSSTTLTPTTPASVSYYNAWTADIPDRKLSAQMATVINHFQNEGFNIVQKKNTVTGNTFLWEIYW